MHAAVPHALAHALLSWEGHTAVPPFSVLLHTLEKLTQLLIYACFVPLRLTSPRLLVLCCSLHPLPSPSCG